VLLGVSNVKNKKFHLKLSEISKKKIAIALFDIFEILGGKNKFKFLIERHDVWRMTMTVAKYVKNMQSGVSYFVN
jgi:hypothetical protein